MNAKPARGSYEQGYHDGESSLAADIRVQFTDAAQSMDDLLGFFRVITGDSELAWPRQGHEIQIRRRSVHGQLDYLARKLRDGAAPYEAVILALEILADELRAGHDCSLDDSTI